MVEHLCETSSRIRHFPPQEPISGSNFMHGHLCQAKIGFRALLDGFPLQNERRKLFFRFPSAAKVILPYRKSAAGEMFAVSELY